MIYSTLSSWPCHLFVEIRLLFHFDYKNGQRLYQEKLEKQVSNFLGDI
jgi:hypothetical protein